MRPIPTLLAAALFLAAVPLAYAQGPAKKEKPVKEAKDRDVRDKTQKQHPNHSDKSLIDKDHPKESSNGKDDAIVGRVIAPKDGSKGPRQLDGVPPGHFPPAGQCRIWYPNRPPGHQPPPTDCRRLVGTRLEPGAFILHGDKAYDADYDWRSEERRKPGTVNKDIIEILPNRK
ncbi:MAG TPA: hypothetical protein VEY71_05515 [Chitinophagales bacterium]|nr:hypothetical protein [Chitinophagales bacterium]